MLYLWDFYQPKDVVTPRVPLDRFATEHTWFGEFLLLIGRIVAAVSFLSHSGSGIDSIASPDRLEARVSRQDGAGDRQHCGRATPREGL